MTLEGMYVLVPSNFSTKVGTVKDKPNVFNAVLTVDNRLVAALNSLTEFPDIFDGVQITILQLSQTDFPIYNIRGVRIN